MTWSPTTSVRPERSRGMLRRVSRLRSTRTVIVEASLLLLATSPALADSDLPAARWANSQLPDARQEAAARALMEEIRCLVCQGQSIADSDAELAGDMRAVVRTRIAAGERPEAVRGWLVERYGAWVSYRPPVEPLSWPLWAAPLALLGLAAWLVRKRLVRRR